MKRVAMTQCEDIDLSAIKEAMKAGCHPLAGRDLLRLLDLTPAEFELVVKTARFQKEQWAQGIFEPQYPGGAVAIIMEKPSLRTRTSFEVGVARMGAHPVVMADDHSAFSRGETIQDTTLVLERFVDAIVLRTFEQSKLEEVAEWAQIPVINALSDDFHPCQGLADALTILEHKGKLKGLKLAYIGDGSNNMAHTYLELGALAGMDVRIGTPENYLPYEWVLEDCKEVASQTDAAFNIYNSAYEAIKDADVVLTDTWTSMGNEEEHDQRLKEFEGFQVNSELMSLAASNALFMHCLPAHRGEEVSSEVIDSAQSVIYDEAENRLHAQKALLSMVLGVA